MFDQFAPSRRGDVELARYLGRLYRHAASPSSAAGFYRQLLETDISALLPTIDVPTLVMTRKGDITTPPAIAQRTAKTIPGARYVELEGDDWWPFLGDVEAFVAEVEAFVAGSTSHRHAERVLTTVLFTDIVGSTERAVEVGDKQWASMLEEHHSRVRSLLNLHSGREIDVAGDGFFAVFDGPARAIRCARAAVDEVRELGLEIRAGVHTGECQRIGDRLSGIAVHVGARVGAAAGANEVLVSQVVRDLSAGSGLLFEDAGEHELKGVPDHLHLYRVTS
jgi:class 3 adenylate cyclase